MAKFTQLSIVVNAGAGANATVVIPIPPGPLADPNATDQSSGQDNAQQAPGVSGFVNGIMRVGFWDAAGANFYPPASILKITPQ